MNTTYINIHTQSILGDIYTERGRQDDKWGEQNHPAIQASVSRLDRCEYYGLPTEQDAKDNCEHAFRNGNGTWAEIAIEEMAEAISAETPEKMREELVQLAAVVVGWIESMDRNELKPKI